MTLRACIPLALLIGACAGAPAQAQAQKRLKVVTTLADLASIAEAVGGDAVEVTSLTTGREDPHYISPTPALMTLVQDADLYVEIGLQLELWSERLLSGAGNPRVRVGQPGHLYASEGIRRLQLPKTISRSEGDLHPDGNPHMWLDPLAAKRIAKNIADALGRLAPGNKAAFQDGLAKFQKKIDRALLGPELYSLSPKLATVLIRMLENKGLDALLSFLKAKRYKGKPLAARLGGWLGKARALSGQSIVFYHKSWVYFATRYGLEVRGYVEEKPGIAPSARHRDTLVALMKEQGVEVVAATNYYPESIARQVAEDSDATFVALPGHVKGVPEAKDYFSFMDYLLDRLSSAYGR